MVDETDAMIDGLERLLDERTATRIADRAAELGLPLLPWQVEHLRWLLRSLRAAR